ncbi:hypothetical protein AB0O82_32655 [Kitasatospora sp. NPDC088264]|uniref:hypothetical protein n=1 Tax=Kitasatospora sp. NPDC088264 TaxID=3155296 RepID=UPI003445E4F4
MALPAWMTDHIDTTAESLTALSELGRWLDAPQNRLARRNQRIGSQAARVQAARELHAAEADDVVAPLRIAELEERAENALGRAGLVVLAEELAERTLLRITTTIARPSELSANSEALQQLAEQIATGIRALMANLTSIDHLYPAEARRNAREVLADLTDGYDARTATGSRKDLTAWSEAVDIALTVIQMAVTRA